MGRRVISAAVDVRSREDVDRVINSAYAALGRLDVLVNNAGISLAKTPFQKQVSVGWDQILGVNLDLYDRTNYIAQRWRRDVVRRKHLI
jgi:NADP-dependent 3-hydroxy acid dehydrogenase YdfG